MARQDSATPADAGSRVVREVALTAGAVFGVVCLVAAVASMLLGVTPLVFRSGSMAPTISTGALGLARTVPSAEIREGDVVSIVNDAGTRITHRVVSAEAAAGGATTLTLKGDGNQATDPVPVVVPSADRLFFHVERLGYLVSWLTSSIATFLGGLLVGILLMVGFRPTLTPRADAATADDGVPGADAVLVLLEKEEC